jgi:hypothetical protein
MLLNRSAALAMILIGCSGAPALAATCNLTVLGASVFDDATCAVTAGRGGTTVAVEGGSTIRIRRTMMSARFAATSQAPRRRLTVSYGKVVVSDKTDDKTCYFNQKAVLCVEP